MFFPNNIEIDSQIRIKNKNIENIVSLISYTIGLPFKFNARSSLCEGKKFLKI